MDGKTAAQEHQCRDPEEDQSDGNMSVYEQGPAVNFKNECKEERERFHLDANQVNHHHFCSGPQVLSDFKKSRILILVHPAGILFQPLVATETASLLIGELLNPLRVCSAHRFPLELKWDLLPSKYA